MADFKSIGQIGEELRKVKTLFEYTLNSLPIPDLEPEEDIEQRTPTLATVLKDLPPEEFMKEKLETIKANNSEHRKEAIRSYKGKYELIKAAGQNAQNLKAEAERLYYLAVELNPYKIKNEFTEQARNNITLQSYKVFQDESARVPRYERNTICPTYTRQLRQDEGLSLASVRSIPECMPLGEEIVSISLYDSLNGEKTFEYLCLGEQTLLEVVRAFYCLIAKLDERQMDHHYNSYLFIEENFYFNGSGARSTIQQIVSFSSSNLTTVNNVKPRIYEMERTRVKDLRVVFGRPYLFRHLEGCDHMVVFKDMRVSSENTLDLPLRRNKYPLAVFESRMRRRKCEGCKNTFAEIVSLNDPLKKGKHIYLCRECHRMMHEGRENEEHIFIKYLHD